MKELSGNIVEVAKDMGGTTISSRRLALRHKSKELGAAETLLTEKILERRACSNFERAKVIAGGRILARKKEEVEECQAMGDKMYAASFSGAACFE